MEDRLQDSAAGIGNIRILPVERDAVGGAGVVPEAQGSASRHRPELLIERAVSKCLTPVTTKWGRCDAQRDSGESPGVRERVGNLRSVEGTVNDPWREAASLKTAVLD